MKDFYTTIMQINALMATVAFWTIVVDLILGTL